MCDKMLKKIILLTGIFSTVFFHAITFAEVVNKAMLDREAVSIDKTTMAGGVETWQRAKLPVGVIPAIEPIKVPRNQKVRIMSTVPRVIKTQPVVSKPENLLIQPVVKTIPKIHDTVTPIYPKPVVKTIKSE
jgi:hypothetical protein